MSSCLRRYSVLLAIVALIFCVEVANANIFTFKDTKITPGSYDVSYTTMFSAYDSPATGYPGHGDSIVHINVSITQDTGLAGATLDVVVVEYKNMRSYLGGENGQLCCTPEMDTLGQCHGNAVGTAIVSPGSSDTIFHARVQLAGPGRPTEFEQVYPIQQSGFYYLYLINCRSNFTGLVHVHGHAEFRNPYGWLPAAEWPFLYFFMVMLGVYMLYAVVWGILLVVFKQDILLLQVAITVALAFSLIEGALFYLYYFLYNLYGHFIFPLYIGGIVLDTARVTISALLVLAVAKGYLVIHEDLGSKKYVRIIACGAFVYWGLSVAGGIMEALQDYTTHQIDDNHLAIIEILIKLVSFVYYIMLFHHLLKTVHSLRNTNENEKKRLYVSLLLILILTCLFAFLFQMVELIIVWDSTIEKGLWHHGWVWFAYWQILYLAVMTALGFLLRPTSNNKRYAYNQVLTEVPMDRITQATAASFSVEDGGEETSTALEISSPAPKAQTPSSSAKEEKQSLTAAAAPEPTSAAPAPAPSSSATEEKK